MEAQKMSGQTADLAADGIAKLRALFPDCVNAQGEVDFEALRTRVGAQSPEEDKSIYRLSWNGKETARAAALAPSMGTLRPVREKSVDFDTTRNLYVEGDNLETLKLLRGPYAGRVKMIYIDPPYNTGKDFVYHDDYREPVERYRRLVGLAADDGTALSTNSDSSGRFHTNWLNMIYPRLLLARELLRDDGVIFISIDDNEVANLRKVCDEVFGAENVESCLWVKVSDDSGKLKVTYRIRQEHEYIVVCYKNKEKSFFNKYLDSRDYKNEYTNPDNDPRGPYKQAIISSTEENSNPSSDTYYSVRSPSGKVFTRQWRVKKWEMDELIAENRIYFGTDGNAVPSLKAFISEPRLMTPSSVFQKVGTAKTAGAEIEDLFGAREFFSYPKPTELLKRIIQIVTDYRYSLNPDLKSDRYVFRPGVAMSRIDKPSEDIILDFFSGSATTAHAVMQLNAEDGGKRKFILVQLPEPCPADSAAAKAEPTHQK